MNLPIDSIYQCRCGAWNPGNQVTCLRCKTPRCDGSTGNAPSAAEGREAALHEKIGEYCVARKWLVFHGSMARRTFRTKGEPDFIILADHGRTLLIECKSAKGKLSAEQGAIAHQAELLGHKVHIVRSYKAFCELVDG